MATVHVCAQGHRWETPDDAAEALAAGDLSHGIRLIRETLADQQAIHERDQVTSDQLDDRPVLLGEGPGGRGQ